MTPPLAREGVPFALACVVATALALLWAFSGGWGARAALPAASASLTLFVAYFFRDPKRVAPAEPSLVAAPADGRVASVGPVEEPVGVAPDHPAGAEAAGRAATRISIFLSIFDVHVQRTPLAGRVTGYGYRPGRYLAAWRPEASRVNEQASLAVETAAGPIVVRQIAGLVARRIVTYPRPGESLRRGERIGLIRFGSRVDLLVPREWRVTVRPGDRVRAGETPVAVALGGRGPGPAKGGRP